jgi:hypothetical protein
VIGRERQVPALRGPAFAHRHGARVVEQTDDREIERDDVRSRTPHALDV